MKKIKSKSILKKSIYASTIGLAVAGSLFMAVKMYPQVQISKGLNINSQRHNIKLELASVQTERKQNIITSRELVESRTTIEDETEKQETAKTSEQETTKTEKKVSKKETKITSKKANQKTNKKISEKTQAKKEEKSEEEKKDTTNKTSIKEVKISKDMDLTIRTGLSKDEFIKLISGLKCDTSGFFEKNAGTIYDLCKKYNINEIFFCGLISAESGWNIASNHRRTHNYISLMKNGKLISYGSVYEGLEVAAQKLHNNYLTPGGKFYHGKTLSGVKTCFCPSSGWVNLVYGRMKQIV